MNALILVDIQNDFLPGGPLAVPEGDQVVPVANAAMPRFDHVVATQDWHPPGHVSFASRHPGRQPGDVIEVDGLQQLLWPDHCVQDTPGADFPPGLHRDGIHHVFRKGSDPSIDSYSALFDNGHVRQTGLGDDLNARGVTGLFVMGLATDVCVKYTALDARKLGFAVKLIQEGVRGVELNPGDCRRALDDMQAAGVQIISLDEIPN